LFFNGQVTRAPLVQIYASGDDQISKSLEEAESEHVG
jgi:hypothetical protein